MLQAIGVGVIGRPRSWPSVFFPGDALPLSCGLLALESDEIASEMLTMNDKSRHGRGRNEGDAD